MNSREFERSTNSMKKSLKAFSKYGRMEAVELEKETAIEPC